jgi:PAS domain S-box-containing protein
VQPNGSGTGWERLFWFVFQNSSHPVVLIDDQRRLVEANDAALEIAQRTRLEVLGSPVIDFIAPADRAESDRRWQEIVHTESGEYWGTGTLLRADQSEVSIEFASRMVQVGGRRLAVYVFMSEVGGPPFAKPTSPSQETPLTKRERQIVTAIAMGHETPQIAEDLHISPATVRTHVRNAMTKLQVHTRAHLVARVLSQSDALHLPHLEE